jgi:hypothetical protein
VQAAPLVGQSDMRTQAYKKRICLAKRLRTEKADLLAAVASRTCTGIMTCSPGTKNSGSCCCSQHGLPGCTPRASPSACGRLSSDTPRAPANMPAGVPGRSGRAEVSSTERRATADHETWFEKAASKARPRDDLRNRCSAASSAGAGRNVAVPGGRTLQCTRSAITREGCQVQLMPSQCMN